MDPTALPPVAWLLVLSGILVAVATGFALGVMAAPWFQARAIDRASRQLEQLFELVVSRMNETQKLARRLQQFSSPAMWSEPQLQRLAEVNERLIETVQGVTCPTAAPAVSNPIPVAWQLNPSSESAGLPDKSVFEVNLPILTSSIRTSGCAGGLLMFQIEKSASLAQRLGIDALETLQKQMITVVLKSIRDTDLVCRLSSDLLAVLLPNVGHEGPRLANAIRSAVKEHRFRVTESSPEVLVTASFGYATMTPDDQPGVIYDKTLAAIDKSRSEGRNQLTIWDAEHGLISC